MQKLNKLKVIKKIGHNLRYLGIYTAVIQTLLDINIHYYAYNYKLKNTL
jgi:hypothetical protein